MSKPVFYTINRGMVHNPHSLLVLSELQTLGHEIIVVTSLDDYSRKLAKHIGRLIRLTDTNTPEVNYFRIFPGYGETPPQSFGPFVTRLVEVGENVLKRQRGLKDAAVQLSRSCTKILEKEATLVASR